jgi:hypothetical protein
MSNIFISEAGNIYTGGQQDSMDLVDGTSTSLSGSGAIAYATKTSYHGET